MRKDSDTKPSIERHSRSEELARKLKNLTEVPSVSGDGQAYGPFLKDLLYNLTDNVYIDQVGNVIATKGKPSTFIFVHMDSIGFLVSSKNDQGIRVISVKEKGARPSDNPWEVQILTSTGSIIGNLYKSDERELLAIDLPKEQLSKVNIGNSVSLASNIQNLDQNTVSSQGLDNKLGILAAIETFKNVPNIGIVATVQEETTGRGATKAAWDLKPNSVVILDTTYDESDQGISGPTIGNGPSICLKDSLFPDRNLAESLIKAGIASGVPVQYEVLESGSSDANHVHTAWGYTPFVFLGIPIKNMHSPNEIGDIRDVEDTIKLLTNFFNTRGSQK